MSTELAARPHGLQINDINELARVADMFAKSGLFKDASDAAKAGVKIMAGQAWGIDPFSAMTGINIIAGKPAIGAHLMAAKVKASGKYDYRVKEMTDQVCSIEFFQGAESIGVSTFTIEDARKAGTQNLQKFPRNMLFARSMSNGQRWYCPDVFTAPTYTPEELGAQVDGEGNVIEVARVERAAPDRQALPAADPHPFDAGPPVDIDAIAEPVEVEEQPELGVAPITGAQLKALHTIGTRLGFDNGHRDDFRAFVGDLVGRELASSKELTKAEAMQLLDHSTDEWAAMLDSWNAERQMAAEGAA